MWSSEINKITRLLEASHDDFEFDEQLPEVLKTSFDRETVTVTDLKEIAEIATDLVKEIMAQKKFGDAKTMIKLSKAAVTAADEIGKALINLRKVMPVLPTAMC